MAKPKSARLRQIFAYQVIHLMEKSGILTQSRPLIERLRQHRWTIGIAGAISALSMAAALAVPVPTSDDTPSTTVVEQLSILGSQPIHLGNERFLREERIQRGDTVGSILARMGINDPTAAEFIRTNHATRVMHQQLAPGKIISAETSGDGELQALHFPLNGQNSVLVLERDSRGRLTATERAQRLESLITMKATVIRSSLFAATDAAGIPDSIATQTAEIFGAEIDFHRDLRKDDRLTVVYEMHYLRGQATRSGRILAVELVNNGKTHRAFRFDQGERTGYYTANGESLQKSFLRSPLEFSRITSGFAMRFHPILQQWRAHKGIDYGAPTGTKVRATGDGTVDFVGQQGGYGNFILLRHPGNYFTAYGHLQSFARGVKRGARVQQGDTIGYVGSTGWATGPHLHYEFRIDNRQINPLAHDLPVTPPLDSAQLARFKDQTNPLAAQLNLLHGASISALD